jgi:hypothetical protein
MSISLEIKLRAPIMLHIQTIEQLSILINKIRRSHEYKWFGTLHFCVVRKKKVEYGLNVIFRQYKKVKIT